MKTTILEPDQLTRLTIFWIDRMNVLIYRLLHHTDTLVLYRFFISSDREFRDQLIEMKLIRICQLCKLNKN